MTRRNILKSLAAIPFLSFFSFKKQENIKVDVFFSRNLLLPLYDENKETFQYFPNIYGKYIQLCGRAFYKDCGQFMVIRFESKILDSESIAKEKLPLFKKNCLKYANENKDKFDLATFIPRNKTILIPIEGENS